MFLLQILVAMNNLKWQILDTFSLLLILVAVNNLEWQISDTFWLLSIFFFMQRPGKGRVILVPFQEESDLVVFRNAPMRISVVFNDYVTIDLPNELRWFISQWCFAGKNRPEHWFQGNCQACSCLLLSFCSNYSKQMSRSMGTMIFYYCSENKIAKVSLILISDRLIVLSLQFLSRRFQERNTCTVSHGDKRTYLNWVRCNWVACSFTM